MYSENVQRLNNLDLTISRLKGNITTADDKLVMITAKVESLSSHIEQPQSDNQRIQWRIQDLVEGGGGRELS